MNFFYLNPYYWGTKFRNFLYQKGIFFSFKVKVPVISVGNLSMGGTGKTSLVRWFVENFSFRFRLGILSRGYGRKTKGTVLVAKEGKLLEVPATAGDEPYLLGFYSQKKGFPVSIVVDENRVRGAKFLIKECGVNLIILDDGFQHLRLKRDLDIVLLKKGDLKTRLFPFGRLREPLSSLKRADAIILMYQELESFDFEFEDKPVFKAWRKDWRVWNADLSRYFSPEELRGKSFIAFCGLGDNKQFFRTLKKLGINLEAELGFKDHFDYKNFKLRPDKLYITTLKDMVKLPFLSNLFILDFSLEIKGLKEFIENFLKGEKILIHEGKEA